MVIPPLCLISIFCKYKVDYLNVHFNNFYNAYPIRYRKDRRGKVSVDNESLSVCILSS